MGIKILKAFHEQEEMLAVKQNKQTGILYATTN